MLSETHAGERGRCLTENCGASAGFAPGAPKKGGGRVAVRRRACDCRYGPVCDVTACMALAVALPCRRNGSCEAPGLSCGKGGVPEAVHERRGARGSQWSFRRAGSCQGRIRSHYPCVWWAVGSERQSEEGQMGGTGEEKERCSIPVKLGLTSSESTPSASCPGARSHRSFRPPRPPHPHPSRLPTRSRRRSGHPAPAHRLRRE